MEFPEGAIFEITGWGTTSENDNTLSSTIKKVALPYVKDDYCTFAFGEGFFPNVMICAGGQGKVINTKYKHKKLCHGRTLSRNKHNT